MSYNDAFYHGLEFKRKLGLYVKCMKEDLDYMYDWIHRVWKISIRRRNLVLYVSLGNVQRKPSSTKMNILKYISQTAFDPPTPPVLDNHVADFSKVHF